MLNAYNKIVLGEGNVITEKFSKLSASEKGVLIPLLVLIFWMGVYPDFFLRISEPSVKALRDIIYSSHGIISNSL